MQHGLLQDGKISEGRELPLFADEKGDEIVVQMDISYVCCIYVLPDLL